MFLLSFCLSVSAGEYNVEKSKKNQVKFISQAPLEDFEGVTSKIDGYLMTSGDGQDFNGSEIYFEVDLNSVDTGIGLRNRHMRENYLHTDKHPKTTFKGKIIDSKKSGDGKYAVTAEGDMFIHGVTKKIKVNGTISYMADQKIKVESNFKVKLPDYKVEVPSLMAMKINESITLELDFVLKFIK